jgi:hypothetical protein
LSRTPPAHVARQLRQEAGFGCVVCGNPIIEYHHIIEWAEKKHFDPNHMVVLCRNHHFEYGNRRREHAYDAKANPINIRNGRINGYLVTRRENQNLVLGNTRFVGATTAVSYFGIPLFGHRIENSEILLQAFVPDENFWPIVEVQNNEVRAFIDEFWDIEFKPNFVKFRKRKGQNYLSFDFRKDDVEVAGNFLVGGEEFVFSPTRSDFGGPRIENMTLQTPHGGTAIQHGGPKRLLRPNYAMLHPRALLVD